MRDFAHEYTTRITAHRLAHCGGEFLNLDGYGPPPAVTRDHLQRGFGPHGTGKTEQCNR
jgi:hypothetical protein